jgi:hypothetical protein
MIPQMPAACHGRGRHTAQTQFAVASAFPGDFLEQVFIDTKAEGVYARKKFTERRQLNESAKPKFRKTVNRLRA